MVKARKINIENYKVQVTTDKGTNIELPYSVVNSIENVVLASGPATKQKLNMYDVLKNAQIIDKIKEAALKGENFVLLEEIEYSRIKVSFEQFQMFGVNEVELCKRINEAELVDVKEVKK